MDRTFKGRSIAQSFDWKLVGAYLLLVFIGLLNIYASIHSSEPGGFFSMSSRSGKQFCWLLVSMAAAGGIMALIPPRLWEGAAVPLYLMVFMLLVAVIFLGIDVKGSRSWFAFGPVRFQPAEVSKISTSLTLALLMSRSNYKMSRPKDFLITALVIGLPMLVILAESETGSALVYVGFIFVLYREGLSGWFLMMIGMAILVFILTLTASTYVSVLVLGATVALICALRAKNTLRMTAVTAAAVLFFALLPWLWRELLEWMMPGSSILGTADPFLREMIMDSSPLSFLTAVKPLHMLLGCCAIVIPFVLHRAYADRNRFLGLSVLAFVTGVALSFSTSFIFNDVLQDHQRKRIEVLLGMKEDPSGVGYNVNQSMIAIGSGGFHGKGFLNGTQTSYGFVPEQSTDFIFCTIGEEWGFVGCLGVICLYVFLIFRLVRDAEHCRSAFTRIYGYCVASCIFMHLFINIGMTIGLMPVIGIPLPYISYGGSSLLSFSILLFIFIALYHEEKKYF